MTFPSIPKRVRAALQASLTGQTIAEDRVYKTRITALRPSEYPALGIYTTLELVDPDSIDSAPRIYYVNLTVIIEGELVGPTSGGSTPGPDNPVDDQVDDFVQRVKQVVFQDETLGGVVFDLWVVQTETAVIVDGKEPHGGFRLTLNAFYQVEAFDFDGTLDDFKRADIKHNLGGAQDAADQAEDLQPVET